ncbi:hypothetical protein [Halorubrum kocurii]|uniref:hypothetical protein n=1 Tax=Halorubrum kocurii TaxID=478441 RepID=UPI000677E62E|nr:hypothetical protein [Halorubrum kocurii]
MSRSLVRRLLIIGCAVVAIAVVGVSAGTADAGVQFDAGWTQTDDPQPNATTVRHEDPDSVTRSGNTSALERRLSVAVTDRLAESARRIEAGEYDTAQRLLADGYDERVTRYMEVYRTVVTTDLERVERRETLLIETAALQTRYAERLSEYRRVAAEYESARQSDDRERAQRRARELSNISSDLRRIEQSLTPRYRAIAETTHGSVTTADNVVSATTTETAQRTAKRVRETYTSTEVSAEASANGSFAEPVRITGRLTAEDNDPPSGNVSFRVNGRHVTTTVDRDGTFDMLYRPVTAPEGPARVSVSYAPGDAALYLPSRTEASTAITQSTPAVSIDDASSRGRVGSSVTAGGRVTVENTPVSNTSVTLRIDGRRLAETRTEGDGTYRFDTRLPANVSAGNRTLSVSVGSTGTALTPVTEDSELTVEETPTQLTLSAVRSGGAVDVSGRLVTDTEAGVSGREVDVSLDGDQRATVRTADDGSFQTSVELSNATNASDAVSVQAAFDGSGTNLGSATVDASLTPPGQGISPGDTRPLTLVLVAGLVAVAAGAVVVYRNRRESGSARDSLVDAVQPTALDPGVVAAPVTTDVDGSESDPDSTSGSGRTEEDS